MSELLTWFDDVTDLKQVMYKLESTSHVPELIT
jgi:hypothetical protein